MTLYYIGSQNGKGPTDTENSLPKARARALRMLKANPMKEVVIENARTGLVEGYVFLNYRGTGVWKVGRTAWLVNKDGTIHSKQPYW